MAKNLIKDKIAEMVKRAVKTQMEGTELTWPEHSVAFLGHVAAGSGRIEVINIDESQFCIHIMTPGRPHYFMVKVSEQI